MLLKYRLGEYRFYPGVVLRQGKKGKIQNITYQKGGDWITIKEDGELRSFPLTNYLPKKSPRAMELGELTVREFCRIAQQLDLPRLEVTECYFWLRMQYLSKRGLYAGRT